MKGNSAVGALTSVIIEEFVVVSPVGGRKSITEDSLWTSDFAFGT